MAAAMTAMATLVFGFIEIIIYSSFSLSRAGKTGRFGLNIRRPLADDGLQFAMEDFSG
jgi:hypothetical protein